MGEENVTPSEDDLEELLRKAKEARADNNPQQALGYVIEARKKWGDHDRVLFSLATIFSDLGMQDGAITVYRTLRARRPHDPLVLNNLAAALDGTGERDEALAIINEALHHDPQDANLYVTKAIILHHAHALDDAEAALEHALQLDNKHGAAWLNLAEVKTDKGELHDCLACQRRALDVLGPLPLLRFNMAHTLFKLGQLSEAWPLYEARFKSSAGQPPVHARAPHSYHVGMAQPCQIKSYWSGWNKAWVKKYYMQGYLKKPRNVARIWRLNARRAFNPFSNAHFPIFRSCRAWNAHRPRLNMTTLRIFLLHL